LPEPKGDLDGFPAISPDGQTIVFGLVPESGVARLWALSLATGESRLLPDTEYGSAPFWSPDGRFIAFFSRGQLRRLELSTGLTRALAAASDPRGGAWSESGDLFFTPNSAVGLFRVSFDGGAVTPATDFDSGKDESHRYPTPLPGGKAIVDQAQASLGLRPEQVRSSRQVLRECGNMSSPTILFLLKAILDESPWPAGAALGALAFGPGLTVEFGLMRLAGAAPAATADPAAGGAADVTPVQTE
jgi:Tol biopolymer transport system component